MNYFFDQALPSAAWNRTSSRGYGTGFRPIRASGWGPVTTPQFYGWATAQNASPPSTSSPTESTFSFEDQELIAEPLSHAA